MQNGESCFYEVESEEGGNKIVEAGAFKIRRE